MGLAEKTKLISELVPPFHHLLATQLVDEFVSMERRYIQCDWEPAELDGGQFCEILARIIYHVDSGNLNLTKPFDECATYVENNTVGLGHNISPRHDALHLVRVLRTVYKFRSQRGAVHISPTYTPNHMDSRLLIEAVRWCMAESLRIFWQGDREQVAKVIRELLQFDVPCIGLFEGILIVQRVDLTAEEEILILLHHAGEQGYNRSELGCHAQVSPASVTRAVQKLESPQYRQIVCLNNGRYRLTDLGSKRIREELSHKLLAK